eukprot:g58.t1
MKMRRVSYDSLVLLILLLWSWCVPSFQAATETRAVTNSLDPCANDILCDQGGNLREANGGSTEGGLYVGQGVVREKKNAVLTQTDLGTRPRGRIGNINVTDTGPLTDLTKVVNVPLEKVDTSDLKETAAVSSRCDEAKSMFERLEKRNIPRSTIPQRCIVDIDKAYARGKVLQSAILTFAKGSNSGSNKRMEAAAAFRNVSVLADLCARKMAESERFRKLNASDVSRLSSSKKDIERLILTGQSFRCCADAVERLGVSCSLDPDMASRIAASLTATPRPSAPAAPRSVPQSWMSCNERCSRNPTSKSEGDVARENRERLEDAAIRELDLLRGARLSPPSDDVDVADANPGDAKVLVGHAKEFDGPDDRTLFFMGCMQGCAGRVAESRDRTLRQVGCEDHLEKSRCVRISRCRWNEDTKRCSGLKQRCMLYCDSVVDEPQTVENAKFTRRADALVARTQWKSACVFGCNIPRRPRGKYRRKPCRRVDPCEVDPEGCGEERGDPAKEIAKKKGKRPPEPENASHLRFRGGASSSTAPDEGDCEEGGDEGRRAVP